MRPFKECDIKKGQIV